MQNEYWKRYLWGNAMSNIFSQYNKWKMALGYQRYRLIRQIPQGGNLVDLGAGDCSFLRKIRELRPDISLVAVDLIENTNDEDFTYIGADLSCDQIDLNSESIHFIICSQLIEHLVNPFNVFNEAFRLLSPGGLLVVETPAPITQIFPSFSCWFKNEHLTLNFYDDPTHVKVYSKRSMIRLCKYAGFKSVYSYTCRAPIYFAFSFPMIIYGFCTKDSNIFVNGFGSLVGMHIGVVAKK